MTKTKTYADIQKQIADLQKETAALEKEAAKLKSEERQGVIDRMKEAIAVYDITASELGLRGSRAARGKAKAAKASKSKTAAAKYRDAAGNTWVGRGPRPQWLRDALAAGKSLQDFAV